jgi:predicted nucleic acid-binding protein
LKRVFLDNNIILDFLISTREYHSQAVEIIKDINENTLLCYSFGSISDVAYVYENGYKLNAQDVVKFYEEISKNSYFECLSITDEYLKEACRYTLNQISNNKKSDFEDSLQYFCALENSCDVIITNDKNFLKLNIPLIRTNPNIENYTPKNKVDNTQEKKSIFDGVINRIRK